MLEKIVYIVRHGETDANKERYFNHPDESLNDYGFTQAGLVAKRASELSFDKLIASSMKRALQTAEAIAQQTRHEIERSDLFREIHPPTSVAGPPDSQEKQVAIEAYRAAWKASEGDPDWGYEDQETVAKFLDRSLNALTFLETQTVNSMLVVSHGNMIRALVGQVLTGKALTAEQFASFRWRLQLTNTGITMLQHTEEGWKLRTFNDHAHFAE